MRSNIKLNQKNQLTKSTSQRKYCTIYQNTQLTVLKIYKTLFEFLLEEKHQFQCQLLIHNLKKNPGVSESLEPFYCHN